MAFWRQSTDARPVSTRGSQGYFKEILLSADDQIPILGLEQSSFFYCIAEDGIAQISGYLHVNKEGELTEDAVRKKQRSNHGRY